MFKFSSSTSDASAQCTPNLLPCRIHYDGPVEASQRYWAPETTADGRSEVYFRGRKLKGKEINVPEGYRGAIVKDAGKEQKPAKESRPDSREEDDHDEEEDEELSVLQELGSFDRVMLWGHESIAENENAFVKGMGEWISFSEAMHKPGKA